MMFRLIAVSTIIFIASLYVFSFQKNGLIGLVQMTILIVVAVASLIFVIRVLCDFLDWIEPHLKPLVDLYYDFKEWRDQKRKKDGR